MTDDLGRILGDQVNLRRRLKHLEAERLRKAGEQRTAQDAIGELLTNGRPVPPETRAQVTSTAVELARIDDLIARLEHLIELGEKQVVRLRSPRTTSRTLTGEPS